MPRAPVDQNVLDLELDSLADESVGEGAALGDTPVRRMRPTALLHRSVHPCPGVVARKGDRRPRGRQPQDELGIAVVQPLDAVPDECSYRCLVHTDLRCH